MPARPHALATGASPSARDLAADQRHRVVVLWNLTEAPYARQACLHDLALEAMAAAGDAPALIASDGVTSHAALARRARHAARLLRALGAAPRRFVALGAAEPRHAVTGALAALASGAAVVPLDPRWPPERAARVLAASGARVVVGDAGTRARLPAAPGSALWLDGLPEPRPGATPDGPDPTAGGARAGATDPAWTPIGPGSGVVLTHRNLVSQAAARRDAHGAPGRVLVLSPRTSAAWPGAVAWTLLHGGALVLPDGEDEPAAALRALVARAGATHLVVPPHRHEALLAGRHAAEDLASLRVVTLDGPCPPGLAAPHRAALPEARLLAGLARDEAAGLATRHDALASQPPGLLGRPAQNARCYVVDAHGAPTAPGVAGELWLGGDGVAAAYLGRPELTRARFGPDPFRPDEPGARVFKTGARARWRDGGQLELAADAAAPGGPDPVIEVRPPGERSDLRPLWLLHPAAGRRLASHVDGRRAVLALPVGGASAEERAAQLRWRQPLGPYHLAGGALAWDVARHLVSQGEQVGLLALLEPGAPGRPRRGSLALRLIRDVARRVAGAGPDGAPFPGRVLLVRSSQAGDDGADGWAELARGGVDVRVVTTTPAGLLEPPAVDEVGALLDGALRDQP